MGISLRHVSGVALANRRSTALIVGERSLGTRSTVSDCPFNGISASRSIETTVDWALDNVGISNRHKTLTIRNRPRCECCRKKNRSGQFVFTRDLDAPGLPTGGIRWPVMFLLSSPTCPRLTSNNNRYFVEIDKPSQNGSNWELRLFCRLIGHLRFPTGALLGAF